MTKPYMSAGWTFEVTSWENDADNYNTKSYTATTREHAEMIAGLLKLWESDAADDCLSNQYEIESEYMIAELVREWVPPFAAEFLTGKFAGMDPEDIDDDDLVGHTLDVGSKLGLVHQGEFATRHVESWKVIYNPEDIFLNDVTVEFK